MKKKKILHQYLFFNIISFLVNAFIQKPFYES